jgi:penicillin-binding protein 1A
MSPRWWFYGLFGLAAFAASVFLVVGYAMVVAYPNLPSLEALTSYQPKIPLHIFSIEGDLIGEFGEEKRSFVKIEQTPDILRKAIIAAEDERFYEHGGVDYIGVVRAAPSPCRWHETSFLPLKKPSAESSMRPCSRSRSSTA